MNNSGRLTMIVFGFSLVLFACGQPGRAEVVRFEISERSPFADGKSFGEVGPYERIIGKAVYAIDAKDRSNGEIIDLGLAPRDDSGRVTFSADLFILAPRDISQGNGAVLYDVNNRGNKLAVRFFNDAPDGNNPTDPGNGFLMRQGYTIVWSGWNGELLPGNDRLQLHAPIGTNGDEPITGLVRYEIITDKETKKTNINRGGHGAYRPTVRGLKNATLTWRLRPAERRVSIPREQFQLHVRDVDSTNQGQLPEVELELAAGFRQGYLYELIYEARDPLVHGVCFAAVRDLVAALKHGAGKDNPLVAGGESPIDLAYGFGVSQSGRFLREFLYRGFNADEHRRQVFDGLMPHVAGGGLGSFNHRFAQPTAYATQHEHYDWPVDRFPFAYVTQTDPLSKQTDGILRRATASNSAPKVMHTQSATEYWSRSGSLVHTDPLGQHDAEALDNVRIYAFGGTQHGPASFPPSRGKGQTLANPADYRPLLRALLTALDGWCRDGTSPPASRHPTLKSGTLSDWQQQATGFPALPGVRYPELINEPSLLDLGSRWTSDRIIDRQPPRATGRYKVLVPKCDRDGNELGCLLLPEVAVPVATFSGWSLRSRDAGAENDLVGLNGSYIPFPRTKAEREMSGDPRRSLAERYGDWPSYLQQLEDNCRRLAAKRYLLDEDVQRIVARQNERAAPLFADFPE